MPARGDQRVTPSVCPAYKKEEPKAAASNILSVDLVRNPDACEGANLDLGAGVDGEVDGLAERAACRRVSRGRLRDVVVLERCGEDFTVRIGGRAHLALA